GEPGGEEHRQGPRTEVERLPDSPEREVDGRVRLPRMDAPPPADVLAGLEPGSVELVVVPAEEAETVVLIRSRQLRAQLQHGGVEVKLEVALRGARQLVEIAGGGHRKWKATTRPAAGIQPGVRSSPANRTSSGSWSRRSTTSRCVWLTKTW